MPEIGAMNSSQTVRTIRSRPSSAKAARAKSGAPPIPISGEWSRSRLCRNRSPNTGGLVYDYDVTCDGQRFLSAVSMEAEGVRPLILITDWRAELSH
jgi:hypothetical protein